MSYLFAQNSFNEKVCVITGGGTGIGKDIALRFYELGAKIVICGRREAVLIEALRNLDQQRCLHHICDIRKAEDCEKLIDAVLKRFLKLDILINNAGGQFPALAESITPRGFSAVITNNLVGTWNMLYYAGTKAFIPQQHGVVVNVIANVRNGFPTMSHTGAARAGVDNLTKSLAVEWARHHVRVNAVAPGIIESSGTTDKARYGEGMLERAAAVIPMRRVGTLREVTDCVLFLAGDGASFVTGQSLYICGGASLAGDMWSLASDTLPAKPRAAKL